MTRKEYEDRLMDAFEAFEKVWRELNPEGKHIDAFILDGRIHIMECDRQDYPIWYRDEEGTRVYSGVE